MHGESIVVCFFFFLVTNSLLIVMVHVSEEDPFVLPQKSNISFILDC